MLEKDMENLLAQYSDECIEDGLILISQQVTLINRRRPDLLFEDRFKRHLLIEVQKGMLDESHMIRMIDYYGAYKSEKPSQLTRLMFIANQIHTERKEFIHRQGFEFKEISMNHFNQIAKKYNYKSVQGEAVKKEITNDAPREQDNFYSGLPNWSLFDNTEREFLFDKFNNYMISHVLTNRRSLKIHQHSAWILAHKAGFNIYLKPEERKNIDVKLYFTNVSNEKNKSQMTIFYNDLMKQDVTQLKDITVYKTGKSTRSKVLEFVKNN